MKSLISPERLAESHLSMEEKQRYARHLSIPEVGLEGGGGLRGVGGHEARTKETAPPGCDATSGANAALRLTLVVVRDEWSSGE